MAIDNPGPIKIVVSSLSALIAALACTNARFCKIIYVPIRRDKGNASRFRNLQLQEKIVTDISNVFSFDIYFTKNIADAIAQLSCESSKIIDANTIGYLGIHIKKIHGTCKIIGAGSEHLSAFIPRILTINLKDLHLRFSILRHYFQKYGIFTVHCFVKKSARSSFFWKAIPINLQNYTVVCNRIFYALKLSPEYSFLHNLSNDLDEAPSKKLLILLPVAAHYGGVKSDTTKIINYFSQLLKGDDFFTLVKNHPSDGENDLSLNVALTPVHWNTDLSRTFPVEIILNVYQERLFLVGAGSSAMFAVNTSNKFVYYPSSQWGYKLAKRNTNHLLNYFDIQKINLNS